MSDPVSVSLAKEIGFETKKKHDSDSFCCKIPIFNDYLKKIANQDASKNRATVYLAVKYDKPAPKKVYGYFTTNAFSLSAKETCNIFLPSATYGYLPAIMIGRLSIYKDQNLLRGYELLCQILIKCKELSEEVGVLIVVVDPMDNKAYKFYLRQGFFAVSEYSERSLDI